MGLELFNDHSAKCQRPLKGADIRPREVAIGRDVTFRQLLEAIADLYDQHHRQNRCNDHQDNEHYGDAHDLSSDR